MGNHLDLDVRVLVRVDGLVRKQNLVDPGDGLLARFDQSVRARPAELLQLETLNCLIRFRPALAIDFQGGRRTALLGLDLIQRLLNGPDVTIQILGLEPLSHRKVDADDFIGWSDGSAGLAGLAKTIQVHDQRFQGQIGWAPGCTCEFRGPECSPPCRYQRWIFTRVRSIDFTSGLPHKAMFLASSLCSISKTAWTPAEP